MESDECVKSSIIIHLLALGVRCSQPAESAGQGTGDRLMSQAHRAVFAKPIISIMNMNNDASDCFLV